MDGAILAQSVGVKTSLKVSFEMSLKVTGQDNVCYAVIKADGKVLELSQIGGTGNTNRYVRKR